MARLFHSGFEFNSATTGMEWTTVTNGTVQSSVVRSGTYAGQVTSLVSGTPRGFLHQFASSAGLGPYYARFYFRYATAPSAINTIFAFDNDTGVGKSLGPGSIRLNNNGTLELWSSGAQIGSDSAALSANTWYCIEILYDGSRAVGADILTARINGVDFASTTTATLATTVHSISVGGNLDSEAQTTGNWYFDDVAVNNNANGSQTSWPGSGKLVLAKPTGAGDNAATTGVFSYINEIPPSDTATSGSTMIELDTNTAIGDYNMTDSSTLGIASNALIHLISVHARMREEASGATNYTLRIKSASGGTTSTSASVDTGSATPLTNPSGTTNFGTSLIRYTDPTTTVAWTSTGTNSIDNMQVGVATTDGNPDTWCLWLGAYIEYNDPPTVTLNSPADASSGSDTTPTLDFTGTDGEGDDIEYNVQVDTVNTFDSVSGTISQTTRDFSNNIIGGTASSGENEQAQGQSFTAINNGLLSSVDLEFSKTGTPTDNVFVEIRETSQTGTLLGTSSNVNGADIITTDIETFTFSPAIQLTKDVVYYLVVKRSGARDAVNDFNIRLSSSATYTGGTRSTRSNNAWTDASGDVYFVLTISASPLLNKLSVTPDAGFANPDVGGDTHPFISGDNIQYTVQAGDALAAGTYYWRVRGLDPSGSNAYGAWSSPTRSFTITGGGGGGGTQPVWPVFTGNKFWGPRFS